MEFWWTPKSSENPLPWRVLYIIGKLLKRRFLKWACMTHLGIWNTSYGQKKCIPTIKSRELTQCPYAQVACATPLKSSRRGLQLRFKLHPNRRSAQKVIVSQNCGSFNLGDFGTPGTKSHLAEGAVERCRIYYMGEGGGFPQVQALGSLVSSRLPVVCPCTKGVPNMH
jgi:hypothetical protein